MRLRKDRFDELVNCRTGGRCPMCLGGMATASVYAYSENVVCIDCGFTHQEIYVNGGKKRHGVQSVTIIDMGWVECRD